MYISVYECVCVCVTEYVYHKYRAFLMACSKEPTCQYRKCGFHSWVRKVPQRRKWQHTPVFLPQKSYVQRSLAGDSTWGHRSIEYNLATKQQHRYQISLVQFSCSVMFDSLRPHEPQHARPPSPSPTSGVHSNTCPSIQ